MDESDSTLLITTGEIDRLIQSFAGKWNRAAAPQELAGIVKAHVRMTV